MTGGDGTRRRFLGTLAGFGIAGAVLPGWSRRAGAAELPLTPACGDAAEATPRQTEGPYYTPDSPERAVLRESGMAGTPVVLAGLVLARDCRPVPGALVDLWHCDDDGTYDNRGYRLRGHQFTAADGSYRFETIVPGLYPGRTRHFHVKFQAPGGPVLTTQLYFPGEPGNDRDRIFDPALVVALMAEPERMARFDAVIATA
jgi:protocatechuate 3,4-dioxygenase beta subunit